MGSHAELSPSSAHRWTKCTQSISLIRLAGKVNTETIHTRRGTCAHKVLDAALSRNVWANAGDVVEGVIVDDAILAGAKAAFAVLEPYTRRARQWGAEQKLSIPTTGEYGTSDFWAHVGNVILIADYKNGTHRVAAADNQQALLYADGVLNMYVRRHAIKIDAIVMAIVQPNRPYRGGRIWDTWRVSLPVFQRCLEPIKAAVRTIHEGRGKLVSGDHCHMCPAAPWNSKRDTCPKHKSTAAGRDPMADYKDLLQ